MTRVNELVRQAFELWGQAEGFDLTGRRYPGHELYDDLKAVGDSHFSEDDDGLTAFMVLWDAIRRHAAKPIISPLDLYLDAKAAIATSDPYRNLLALLDDTEILGQVAEFRDAICAAADGVGLLSRIQPTIDSAEVFAAVRRDALTAHRFLAVHSFRRGRRAKSLSFNRRVLKFWNVNSALRAAELQPWDGVSCCLIRDPVELWSYFVLIFKDGGNLTLWTDADRPTHPLQKEMSRSRAQERRFHERAFRLRFPYQLLNFEFDDEGRLHGERAGDGLVRLNIQGVSVCELEALEPDQALWLLMMFTLIRDRPRHREALSITGEGLVALPEARASGALIQPVGSADLAPLERADISSEALAAAGVFARESTGQNEWMAARYGAQVPEEALNLIGTKGGAVRSLTTGEPFSQSALPVDQEQGDLALHVPGRLSSHFVARPESLIALDPASFGTIEEIESDRRWVARYNQAAYLGAAARQEFDDRVQEIWGWFESRVDVNWQALLAAIATGLFRGEVQGYAPGHEDRFLDFDHGVPQEGELLTVKIGERYPPWPSYRREPGKLCRFRYEARRFPHYRCWETSQAASVWARFTPWTSRSLAQIAGCSQEDLPDVLRNWQLVERYHGNEILDRLDPVDWAIDNPWRTLEFAVTVGLSLSTYRKLRKAHGLPLVRHDNKPEGTRE